MDTKRLLEIQRPLNIGCNCIILLQRGIGVGIEQIYLLPVQNPSKNNCTKAKLNDQHDIKKIIKF
jgi:hypothetical protein